MIISFGLVCLPGSYYFSAFFSTYFFSYLMDKYCASKLGKFLLAMTRRGSKSVFLKVFTIFSHFYVRAHRCVVSGFVGALAEKLGTLESQQNKRHLLQIVHCRYVHLYLPTLPFWRYNWGQNKTLDLHTYSGTDSPTAVGDRTTTNYLPPKLRRVGNFL